jgi:hypothetical protein
MLSFGINDFKNLFSFHISNFTRPAPYIGFAAAQAGDPVNELI